MPKYVITALGFANGTHCPHAGMYLRSFDHDAIGGIGHGVFTRHANRAQTFKDQREALAFWHRQSKVRPWRADGKPNKPLTALTVSIEPLEEPA